MKPANSAPKYTVRALLLLILLCAGFVSTSAKETIPKTTDDGLSLVENTKMRAVYMKPGASLAQYDRVAILDCYVEFAKDWERHYNDDQVGLEHRVTQKDIDRIKKQLAEEFKVVFTKELQDKGYEVVDGGAKDVLVLRPAIINLQITAPDTMSPGMGQTFVSTAGEMTLYLELYDSLSSELLARIIDPEEARNVGGMAISADRITNKMDADRVLRRWADLLRSHLGAVKQSAE